jgi:hypothetical protein
VSQIDGAYKRPLSLGVTVLVLLFSTWGGMSPDARDIVWRAASDRGNKLKGWSTTTLRGARGRGQATRCSASRAPSRDRVCCKNPMNVNENGVSHKSVSIRQSHIKVMLSSVELFGLL